MGLWDLNLSNTYPLLHYGLHPLPLIFGKMWIHQTPNYGKVPNLTLHQCEILLKIHPSHYSLWTPLPNVHYCITFSFLEKHRKIMVMDHHLCIPNDGPILPLYNLILLRVLCYCYLLHDSCIYTKDLKSLEAYSPPLIDLKALIVLHVGFSIRDLNSLNQFTTSSRVFLKYIQVHLLKSSMKVK